MHLYHKTHGRSDTNNTLKRIARSENVCNPNIELSHELRLLRSQQVEHHRRVIRTSTCTCSCASTSAMDSARGLYSRLAGINPDQDIDEGMDSLLSLPQVNPNQPREWLHIDPQGRTRYVLVNCWLLSPWSGVFTWHACCMRISPIQLPLVSPTSHDDLLTTL